MVAAAGPLNGNKRTILIAHDVSLVRTATTTLSIISPHADSPHVVLRPAAQLSQSRANESHGESQPPRAVCVQNTHSKARDETKLKLTSRLKSDDKTSVHVSVGRC